MKGSSFVCVPFGGRICDQRTNWADRLSARGLPVKAILLPLVTNKFHCVVFRSFTGPHRRGVFPLRMNQGVADFDDIVLVRAYTAVQNLLLSTLRVEIPGTGWVLGNRNGERPVLGSNVECRGAIGLYDDSMHLVVAAKKVFRR